jgi:hypothetical protein
MPDKLPPDFNPDAYAAAYPDVALSGLGAREHFRRFGRLLGRSPNGKPREGKAKAAPSLVSGPQCAVEPGPPAAAAGPEIPMAVQAPPRRPPAGEAIVARPSDFRAEDVVPSPAPEKPSRGAAETFGLDDFGPGDADYGVAETLRSYARMVGVADPGGDTAEGAPRAGEDRFQVGDCRIENAWFADPTTLRVMIAAEPDGGASLAGWAMRAFQALPAAPAELRAAGKGVTFPARGPCFFDIALAHPLMPVLIELVDRDGATCAMALVPFPSLLPGGLHGAEAKALQMAANPIDSFWSLSSQFLDQLIDERAAEVRSVVDVMAETEPGDDSMLTNDVREWLAVVFGIAVNQPAPKTSGVRLVLPHDAIPTIAALVSRRLSDGAGCPGPFIVAQAGDRRPQASVALSARCASGPGVPRLEGRSRARQKASGSLAPVHLGIVYRFPRSVNVPPADGLTPSALPPMTILLDASDAGRTETLVRRLKDELGLKDFELWVRLDGGEALRATLDRLCGAGHWRPVEPRSGLRQLAREAQHDLLLTIDDAVRLEGDTLSRLVEVLDSDDQAASASCLLVGEMIVKKQSVLRPGSAGIFPAGVSFVGGPAMVFAEPDVSDILRDMTYPVVANTMALAVWRRGLLAGLPDPFGLVPRNADDIAVGLDLTRSGYRNLCTTRFSASRAGDHGRRDAIDPLGGAAVAPGQWQDLLDRVTIVRELY